MMHILVTALRTLEHQSSCIKTSARSSECFTKLTEDKFSCYIKLHAWLNSSPDIYMCIVVFSYNSIHL